MRFPSEVLAGPFGDSWKVVLQYFGPDSQITDNLVEKQDRHHFYLLEDAGFLEERTEYNVIPSGNNGGSGRSWRTYYWRLKRERLLASAGTV